VQNTSLRYFYEAAQLGSMRAAGDKMGVAVSSISRQIAQLENELGLLLLERGRRTVKLTEAGELALDYYRRSTAEREQFDSRVRDLRGLKAGRVDIAIGEGFVTAAFSDMINGFINKHVGVQIVSTTAASSVELVRLVAEDEVHCGLVLQTPTDPRVRIKACVPQPIVVLARPDHPIAALSRVMLSDIAQHRVCLVPEGFLTRRALAQAERAENVWLQPAVTTNSLQLLKEMAKSGECVTVLPVIAAIPEIESGSLKAISIATAALENSTTCLITRIGRQLPVPAVRLLSVIEANLRKWANVGQPA
jgi:DNA-binding transcriptional LysR family regulator